MTAPRLVFVVESGCDVRMIEGLAARYQLTVLARRIVGGREISQAPTVPIDVEVGPPGRLGFARLVLRRLLGRHRDADLVLVQGYAFAALAANLAARRVRRPTAMLVCSPVERYYLTRRDHPETGMRFRRHELLGVQLLARINARLGRLYVVLSRHLGDVVRAHGARRVAIAPVYGVDTSMFSPGTESREATRRRLGLPVEGSLLFFSSRVAPEKDAETLLRALRRLRDGGRDVRLLHRSGGWQQFVQAAERYGVADRVLAGDAFRPGPALADAYRACDVCVQASREEGLGFSVLEALACGVPVVATAVGGLRETIRDGETGWSYPMGDDAALADAIADALDHPAEAARRAAQGRAMVLDEFERGQAFAALERALTAAQAGPIGTR